MVESGLSFCKQKLLNETDTSASPLLYPVYQLCLAHNQQHGLKLFPSGLKELRDKIYQSSTVEAATKLHET